MSIVINRRQVCDMLGCMLAATAFPAAAQVDKPVALVVPTSPGGSTDAIARMVAEALPAIMGRAMIVDNRPGANGTIGAAYVAKAPADGSFLLLNTGGQLINPLVMRKLSFDVANDFTSIGGLAQSPLIVIAHAQFEAQTVSELKALATRSPDKVAFAVGDMATRLATEQVMTALGIKVIVANYKGTGPAMTDVAGGHVPLTVTTIGAAMPMLKGGQVKPLGVMSMARLKLLPNVPTLAEQGFPVEFVGWWAISAPSGMPKALVVKLGADLQRLVKSPAFEARLDSLFMTPMALGPAELDAFIARDLKRMKELAAAAGIEPE